ncbi:MAG TPA: ATPase domain-containing protein [Terracidiphilus sp.]
MPEGDSVLVAGSSGTGKSVLATQFIAEGIRQGEPGIVAVFEERPQAYGSGPPVWAWIWKRPRKTGNLRSSIFAPWISRRTKPCSQSSTLYRR